MFDSNFMIATNLCIKSLLPKVTYKAFYPCDYIDDMIKLYDIDFHFAQSLARIRRDQEFSSISGCLDSGLL